MRFFLYLLVFLVLNYYPALKYLDFMVCGSISSYSSVIILRPYLYRSPQSRVVRGGPEEQAPRAQIFERVKKSVLNIYTRYYSRMKAYKCILAPDAKLFSPNILPTREFILTVYFTIYVCSFVLKIIFFSDVLLLNSFFFKYFMLI